MSDTIRRSALSNLNAVTPAQIQVSELGDRARKRASDPDANYGLGIAKVITIDYVEFYVTLRTLSGTSQMFDRVPVPLTFPGAGNRHFFGAMPCVGDYCIVGWIPHTAASAQGGGTKTPVILAWMVPGVWPGLDWVTTAEFERDEFDQAVPANQQIAESAHNFIRHKLRHIQPGNIVGSSAQGSDIVLDESVTLANRRGNEFRLRDQDQAAVTRVLQEFHALAGARVYAGMVQRDAGLLATSMMSDGQKWDDTPQAVAGSPVKGLPSTEDTAPKGFLTPSRMFIKGIDPDTGFLGRSLLVPDPYLDPYEFLKSGGFIDETGQVIDPSATTPNAVYGGKPIYRVARQSEANATLDQNAATLTEYRIEVTHTSDGRLPVTEQTDLFDAERLPQSDISAGSPSLPANVPFIEWVLGSVVGNEVYSEDGRRKYGMPLKAVIFDGDSTNPRLEPVTVDGTAPTPFKDHLATLFRFRPPLPGGGDETFWGVNKSGQLRASIGGDSKDNSAEIALAGGLKLAIGGGFEFLLDGHLQFGTNSKGSIRLRAEDGPVTIFGGGGLQDASVPVSNLSGTGKGAADLPSVNVQGKTNIWVQAQKQLWLKGSELVADASTVDITGQDGIALNGIKQVSVNTENFQVSVSGKCAESFAGPKNLLPTSGPLHERMYTPAFPGLVCEKVSYTWGDREEKFNLGNHKTEILIGNLTYSTKLGTWKAQALANSMEVGPSGVKATAVVGTVAISATAGAVSISGSTGVTVTAPSGSVVIHGSTGVTLSAPVTGTEMGPIITAGSRDPLTNLPFATFGLGAPCHQVSP